MSALEERERESESQIKIESRRSRERTGKRRATDVHLYNQPDEVLTEWSQYTEVCESSSLLFDELQQKDENEESKTILVRKRVAKRVWRQRQRGSSKLRT